jgi:hypothetical protein
MARACDTARSASPRESAAAVDTAIGDLQPGPCPSHDARPGGRTDSTCHTGYDQAPRSLCHTPPSTLCAPTPVRLTGCQARVDPFCRRRVVTARSAASPNDVDVFVRCSASPGGWGPAGERCRRPPSPMCWRPRPRVCAPWRTPGWLVPRRRTQRRDHAWSPRTASDPRHGRVGARQNPHPSRVPPIPLSPPEPRLLCRSVHRPRRSHRASLDRLAPHDVTISANQRSNHT